MKRKTSILFLLTGILLLFQQITLLQAEVVINELFITAEAGTDVIPQFIELYNNSDSEVDISNWNLIIYDVSDNPTIVDDQNDNFTTNNFVLVNNGIIQPFGYLLIASNIFFSFCNPSCSFPQEGNADIWYPFTLPKEYGRIELSDNTQTIQDQITYDSSWPFTNGRSLRLHNPYVDNALKENWSSSPVTDISSRLYSDANDIRNFGSPGEENSFRLFTPVDNLNYVISGDANSIHSTHNYNDAFTFSWDGTFKDTTSQSYRLIINKNGTEINHSNWVSIAETFLVVSPADLQVQQLEIASYTWTVQLQRGSDVVNSDLFSFHIDANDYGIYGCVDNGNCTDGPTCPVSYNDVVYYSNYPAGCTPGENCIRALNYDTTVNISNNTCEYVSLSIPSVIRGNKGDTARIAVYLDNKILAKIYSIDIQFSIENTSILSYIEGTLTGSMLESNGGYTINAPASTFLVDVDTTSGTSTPYANSGVIAGLNVQFAGSPDEITNLILESYTINGVTYNESNNKITSTVLLRDKFEINGHISYYDNCGSSFNSVNNVEVSLKNEAGITYLDTTTSNGVYLFTGLNVGNYNINYHKLEDVSGVDYGDFHILLESFMGRNTLTEGQMISGDVSLDGRLTGIDLSRLARHIINLPLDFNDDGIKWVFKPESPIDYTPLYANDKNSRTITAYQLGDLDGNWNCTSTSGRENFSEDTGQILRTTNEGKLNLDLVPSEESAVQSFFVKLGYDANKFHSPEFQLNSLLETNNDFEFMININEESGEMYILGWTLNNSPQILSEIAKVSLQLNFGEDKGKIWIDEMVINKEGSSGGFRSDEDFVQSILVRRGTTPQFIYLNQNFPNPFNPVTYISWEMNATGNVNLSVFNMQGQLVENLVYGEMNAGYHSMDWNAESNPSGIYFYTLTVGNETFKKKMILLK